MGRTWTTAEVVALVCEAHDRPVPAGSPKPAQWVPWVHHPGSGPSGYHRHDRTTVLAALIYSAIPHPDPPRNMPPWLADTAMSIASHDPASYAPWAVIDPTDGSWFVTSSDGLPVAIRQRTVGMCVHLVNLDRVRSFLRPR